MYKKTTSLYFLKYIYCLHQSCVCRSLLTSGAFSNIENSRESCEESTIQCSGKDKIIYKSFLSLRIQIVTRWSDTE